MILKHQALSLNTPPVRRYFTWPMTAHCGTYIDSWAEKPVKHQLIRPLWVRHAGWHWIMLCFISKFAVIFYCPYEWLSSRDCTVITCLWWWIAPPTPRTNTRLKLQHIWVHPEGLSPSADSHATDEVHQMYGSYDHRWCHLVNSQCKSSHCKTPAYFVCFAFVSTALQLLNCWFGLHGVYYSTKMGKL